MNKVGVKAIYDSVVTNQDTGEQFCIFITSDFYERIAIKADFVKDGLSVGDLVRIDFSSIPYYTKDGKPSAFLGCKVVSKCS